MSAAPARLPSSGSLLVAQLSYQIRLMIRTPRAIFGGVILPVLLLIVSHAGRGQDVAGLAGLAALGVTITAWSTHGITLISARESGVLKRWRASPLPPWCYFLARIAATVITAALAGVATVVIAKVLYGTQLTVAGALAGLAVLLLGALAWAALATAVTGLIPNVASAWPILSAVYLPVVLISGAFGSIGGEAHWMSTLARWLPAQPMIDALTRALSGASLPAHDVLVLAGWLVIGLAGALTLFRWQPTRPAARRPARPDGTVQFAAAGRDRATMGG